MECIWHVNRYSRFYTDYQKQSLDATGRISLFAYFTNSSQTIHSQLVNTGVWSTIMRRPRIDVQFMLKVPHEGECLLQIRIELTYDQWELEAAEMIRNKTPLPDRFIILEDLKFPNCFMYSWKASARTECISFRLENKNERFCFQVDFDSAFECYMCYHTMFRFGILQPQWRNIFNVEMFDSLDFQAALIDRSKVEEVLPNSPPDTQLLEAAQSVSLLEIQEKENDNKKLEIEEADIDLSQLFQPSQPLPSKKQFNAHEHCSCESAEIVLPNRAETTLDLEDENIFTPLSFKEFGY